MCNWFQTGALEAQNAIKTGKLLSLSEQQLIDCDTNSIDKGCIDGDMTSAFDYIIKNGINSEHDYPFEGINNTCRSMSRTELSVKEARSLLEQTEAALREAVGKYKLATLVFSQYALIFFCFHLSFSLYPSERFGKI